MFTEMITLLKLFCWTGNAHGQISYVLTSCRSSLVTSLTTTPRLFSSLNMLVRSSQEKPHTICRSSQGEPALVSNQGSTSGLQAMNVCIPLVLCPVYVVLMAEDPFRFSRIMVSEVTAARGTSIKSHICTFIFN